MLWTAVNWCVRTLPLLPGVLIFRLILSPLNPQEKKKTWRRIVSDGLLRWVIFSLQWKHSKIVFSPTLTTYTKWCTAKRLPLLIEDVKDEEESKLLWLGKKDAKNVILYFHGGGYSWPMQECALDFWRHVRKEVGKGIHDDSDVSVAILTYTLLPEGPFPIPLRQATNAIQTLLDRGVSPQNIQLTGDSAGGNLIVQVLLHMMHPYKSLPRLPQSTKFRGAYMMSPWTVTKAREGVKSWRVNDRHDIVCAQRILDMGQYVLDSVTEKSMMPYIDMTFAPGGWYQGIDAKVDRILMTAGDAECLRDDIIEFAGYIKKVHTGAELIVQPFGVHDDPFYDFAAGEKKLVGVTKDIINWFVVGCEEK